jgi:molybdenum cofactor cytidylyltransferase
MMTAAHDMASPVIVLLAAGEGSRFGGAKQLANIAGEPMVRRVARRLLETDIPVIAVTGAYADDVEIVLDDLPLSMIRCEDWQLGMGNSLAAGVREAVRLFPQSTAVLICLADQPMLDKASIETFLQRHKQASDRILASEHDGTKGPPVLFPQDCFAALMMLSGARGARSLLEQHAARVEVMTSIEGIDVDTPEDLKQVWMRLEQGE